MWSKKVPINMGPKTLHKNVTVDKVREKCDCIVFAFLMINVNSKRLIILNEVNVQIP
jgi:hypothetical protein